MYWISDDSIGLSHGTFRLQTKLNGAYEEDYHEHYNKEMFPMGEMRSSRVGVAVQDEVVQGGD